MERQARWMTAGWLRGQPATRSVVVGRSLRIGLPCGGARRGAWAGAVGRPVSGTRSRAGIDGWVERRLPIGQYLVGSFSRLITRALTEQEAVSMSSYPGDFPIPVDEGGPGAGQRVGGFGGN